MKTISNYLKSSVYTVYIQSAQTGLSELIIVLFAFFLMQCYVRVPTFWRFRQCWGILFWL